MYFCTTKWEQGAKWDEPIAGSKNQIGTGSQMLKKLRTNLSSLERARKRKSPLLGTHTSDRPDRNFMIYLICA